MSTNINSVFEVHNRHKAVWQPFNLYNKYSTGETGLAQLLTGGSEHWGAITGATSVFDTYYDEYGEVVDGMAATLEHIIEILSGAAASGIPPDASNEAKAYFNHYVSDFGGHKLTPSTMTLTLIDILMIEALAKSTSTKATSHFNAYFQPIKSALEIVKRIEGADRYSYVRVIIWAS